MQNGLKKSEAIPRATFNVAEIREEERFDLWKDSISTIFSVDAGSDIRKHNFYAHLDAYMFGNVFLARTESRGQEWSRTSAEIAKDGMDHYMIQYFEEGAMFFEHKSRQKKLGTGCLIVFDLARQCASQTNDFANVSLVVARHELEPYLREPDNQHLRVLSVGDPLTDLLYTHMKTLNNTVDSMSLNQASEVNSATIALIAACLNGSLNTDYDDAIASPLAATIHVKRVIERHLADADLSAEQLAQLSGVSRSKLYTIFAPYGGVKAYVRDCRLRNAMTQLMDPHQLHRPISEIGFSLGFASESAFSRAFKQKYNMTPRDVRQKKLSSFQRVTVESVDRTYERWLRDLTL